MALLNLERSRIILDLLRDGVVADETKYVPLDRLSAARADKYLASFLVQYPMPILYDNGTPPLPRAATNEEKHGFMLSMLRDEIKVIHEQVEGDKTDVARAAARATAKADATTDLG